MRDQSDIYHFNYQSDPIRLRLFFSTLIISVQFYFSVNFLGQIVNRIDDCFVDHTIDRAINWIWGSESYHRSYLTHQRHSAVLI